MMYLKRQQLAAADVNNSHTDTLVMHISTTIGSRISHIFQPNSEEGRDFFAFKKKSLPVVVHFKLHQLAISP
jgi:hypothetical protein